MLPAAVELDQGLRVSYEIWPLLFYGQFGVYWARIPYGRVLTMSIDQHLGPFSISS